MCRMHGGWAPQVRAKAAARLLAGADYAAALLVRQALNHRLDPSDRRAAATAILDRAGLAPGEERDKEPPAAFSRMASPAFDRQ